jgi:hypothetical protein
LLVLRRESHTYPSPSSFPLVLINLLQDGSGRIDGG